MWILLIINLIGIRHQDHQDDIQEYPWEPHSE